MKQKRKTIPERVWDYVRGKPAKTKDMIAEELMLTRCGVDRACRILRKERKVGLMVVKSDRWKTYVVAKEGGEE